MRWTLWDGLASLIDLSRVHLVQEVWWRATGQWSEFEKHAQPPRGDEQRPRDLKPSRADGLRRERRHCWWAKVATRAATARSTRSSSFRSSHSGSSNSAALDSARRRARLLGRHRRWPDGGPDPLTRADLSESWRNHKQRERGLLKACSRPQILMAEQEGDERISVKIGRLLAHRGTALIRRDALGLPEGDPERWRREAP